VDDRLPSLSEWDDSGEYLVKYSRVVYAKGTSEWGEFKHSARRRVILDKGCGGYAWSESNARWVFEDEGDSISPMNGVTHWVDFSWRAKEDRTVRFPN
jgi:hypothetical protein